MVGQFPAGRGDLATVENGASRCSIGHVPSCCRCRRTRPVDELLERAGQLAVLKEALASVGRAGRGTVVVVRGEAGVGKTGPPAFVL